MITKITNYYPNNEIKNLNGVFYPLYKWLVMIKIYQTIKEQKAETIITTIGSATNDVEKHFKTRAEKN